MILVARPIFILFIFVLLSSCQSEEKINLLALKGMTMGTTYSIKYVAPSKKNDLNHHGLGKEIDLLLKNFNQQVSTYIKNSQISRFNRDHKNSDWFEVGPEFYRGLKLALKVAKVTNGYFDPTVGPLVNAWGFGAKKGKLSPTIAEIESLKQFVGFENIEVHPQELKIKKLHPNVYLDLSASAKGQGVDLVAQLLEKKRIHNYLVEIGGEIKTKGSKGNSPWSVAIETPKMGATHQAHKVMKFSAISMATSGDYRNFKIFEGKKFSHIIDVRTGKPTLSRLASVTVLDPDYCLRADAMATALMAMGPVKGPKFALENQVAAYFLIRTKKNNDEFEEVQTPEFKKYLRK